MKRTLSHKRSGIAAWPQDERLLTRLLARGPELPTDAELLAILLRTGVESKNAVELTLETPVRAEIADSENERKFIRCLLEATNLAHYDGWIKSTPTRFYALDSAWKKRNAPKRGKFSPDFFLKLGDQEGRVLVGVGCEVGEVR